MLKEGKTLLFDIKDSIGILTINNPPVNFFGSSFYQELDEFEQFIGKQKLRAMIINAIGKHFSAGIDITYLQQASSQQVLDVMPMMQRIYSFWSEQNYPVIAAVQGRCLGSGVELILGCDIRMVSESAVFALPEVMLGLSPDMGGTARLTRLVGVGQANRMIVTCDQIDAAEALRIGMVEYVVPDEELRERAFKLAKKISKYPNAAVRYAKRGIQVTAEGGVYAGLLFEQAQSTYCCGSEDLHNALDAFLASLKTKK